MLAYLLLLCLTFFVQFVAADRPGGYNSPYTWGGSMVTIPKNRNNNETKGVPLNIILSNKTDPRYDAPPPWSDDYLFSLGYGHKSPEPVNALSFNDSMELGKSGRYISPHAYLFSSDCKKPENACLQLTPGTQNNEYFGATFITAALAKSTADGVKIIENGYDLARDQFVARATSSYSGEPVLHYQNKSFAFKTTVVYNDTELLANVSANDLRDNVGTDRRVPILYVEVLKAPFKEPTKSYPDFNGAAAWASLPTVPVALVASMIALLPMAL